MTAKTILRDIKHWAKDSYECGHPVEDINEFTDYFKDGFEDEEDFNKAMELIKPLCHEDQTPIQYCCNYYYECFDDARERDNNW